MTLAERLKCSRKNAHLTQQSLADAVGLKQNTIATYESGKVSPSDRSVSDIAKICNVDEHWLRTGEGDPKPKLTEYEEISNFVEEVLSGRSDDIKKRFLLALARLDVEGWEAVATLAEKLSGK